MKQPDPKAEMEKAWRLMTAPFRVLPSFVIAGAPKCGTTTLADCIAAHPRVRRGARKEPTSLLHYPGSRLRTAMHYPLRWGGRFMAGDGSVEYFTHPEGPRNVREVLPEARLIFLLRDPVKRAWSDYQMFCKHGDEREPFGGRVRKAMLWLRDPEMQSLVDAASREAFNPVRYVQAGLYARMLERWFAEFPREQCLVLPSEEFFSDRPLAMARVFAHLGLDPVEADSIPKQRPRPMAMSEYPEKSK